MRGVKNDVEKYGYSVIIASEGLKDNDGRLYAASDEVDSFGHAQLGGLAPKIASLIHDNLGYKYHWSVSDYLQRSARHLASKTDIDQAIALGREAVKFAMDGKTGIMPVLIRTSNKPYAWKIEEGDLNDIANAEKTLPKGFISDDGFRITKAGVDYLRPLTFGENYPEFKDGIPIYEQLDLHLAEV